MRNMLGQNGLFAVVTVRKKKQGDGHFARIRTVQQTRSQADGVPQE